jgi:hypothetical protein
MELIKTKMEKQSIAIYSETIEDNLETKIIEIKKQLQNVFEIEDLAVFTKDLMNPRPFNTAIFYDFYLSFHKCIVVFLSLKEMQNRYKDLNGQKIYLYTDRTHEKQIDIDYEVIYYEEKNEKI